MVDFPEPFAPRRPMNSPFPMENPILSMISLFPGYRNDTSLSSSIGPLYTENILPPQEIEKIRGAEHGGHRPRGKVHRRHMGLAHQGIHEQELAPPARV